MAGQVTKKKRPQATRRKTVKKAGSTGSWKPNFSPLAWRRFATALLMLAPVLLISASYIWLQRPENLTIESVNIGSSDRVNGLQYLSKDELRPIVEPFVKTNLFMLDAKGLEEELEFNPWVYSASLTKVWPKKLEVTIYEERPIAFWGEGSMLNEYGEIIDAELPEKIGQLPVLYSPEDNGRMMVENYLKVQQWTRDFPVKIVEFREDARGSWQLKLENGLTVNIGRDKQEKRLRRFVVGYKRELAESIDKIHTVDLRYTNGFAVKWKSNWQIKQEASKKKG
ncbi:FtsQ-type POTRA domain-containing protein [Leucothrix sargassi]|nr:FtsQ-type POTRA domain-containing protein [Leucothrix sargassi]